MKVDGSRETRGKDPEGVPGEIPSATGPPRREERESPSGDGPAHQRPALVFYDGGCGLCHRAVLFALERDPEGLLFRFAPLGGRTFEQTLDEDTRAGLPESVVLLDPDGTLRTRSDAALAIARRVGGLSKPLARIAGVVPRGLRDALYELVARLRRRLFSPPESACPCSDPELQRRFLP